jgi:hypothetical protein
MEEVIMFDEEASKLAHQILVVFGYMRRSFRELNVQTLMKSLKDQKKPCGHGDLSVFVWEVINEISNCDTYRKVLAVFEKYGVRPRENKCCETATRCLDCKYFQAALDTTEFIFPVVDDSELHECCFNIFQRALLYFGRGHDDFSDLEVSMLCRLMIMIARDTNQKKLMNAEYIHPQILKYYGLAVDYDYVEANEKVLIDNIILKTTL